MWHDNKACVNKLKSQYVLKKLVFYLNWRGFISEVKNPRKLLIICKKNITPH